MNMIGKMMAVAAMGLLPMMAQADDMVSSLNVLVSLAEIGGWERTHNSKVDSAYPGEQDSYSFKLRGDKEYMIMGVCDDDCSDMDFHLYDENDNLIDSDTKTDSLPVVEASPKWTGKFTLKTTMVKCSSTPCGFAFTAIGKDED